MSWRAVMDIGKSHAAVFRSAWRKRHEQAARNLPAHEAQFLPAALALRDTPLHPAPRIAMWLIMGFALMALFWSLFGRVDVVATAAGKLIPDDRSKIIQPLEAAVVRAIHVQDGDSVKPGQVLIELDATLANADTERLRGEAQDARLEAMRAQAMLAALAGGGGARLEQADAIPAIRLAAAQSQLTGQFLEYQARRQQLQVEISRRQAELASARQLAAKLEQTLPIARKRADDYRKLVKENFVSEHGYLEREQARIEMEQDLAISRSRMDEIQAALSEVRQQQATLAAETRRQLLEQRQQATQRAAAQEQDLVKAEQRSRQTRLAAPVAGTVQQLSVHTVGGVVTPAQPLMVIMPQDQALVVEAWLPNKDIGFVNAGQEAEVKVETFPFTRYGTLRGRVLQVSPDAIQDERLGLVFLTRVKLATDRLRVENKTVRLSPGMAVTVEVKTGTRRVIEYFLSPLLQYGQESLRER